MKFRICIIAVLIIASAALVVRAVRLSQQEQQVAKSQQATVKVFNNTINNAWVNVPIEITSLGDNNYRVTNKTSMGIKRFIIALYAAYVGKPAHGPGAQRHYVPVRFTDKPIAPGKSIEINIEQQLREFDSSEHNHAADMKRIEMLPYAIDFADEYQPAKRWMGGKYLRSTGPNGWEEDPDLNPKENKDLIGTATSAQGCYVYGCPLLALAWNAIREIRPATRRIVRGQSSISRANGREYIPLRHATDARS